jgi:alpha-galactosidase
LPKGLALDETSGVISGSAPAQNGEYKLTFIATNAKGKDEKTFKLVVGDRLGLTPQMGWNDWYTHYEHISDADIRKAADAMIASGMADFGYQFVSIDDAWERRKGSIVVGEEAPTRSPSGDILTNTRFPDMKALTSYVHSLGLRAGIYSSPGPLTCAKFEASYGHEAADAQQIAKWGFDLLKYDMCSYRTLLKTHDLDEVQEPYKKMGNIVQGLDRDIIFNMCQYGMGDVWNWGKKVGGSSWRTTGDLGLAPTSNLPGFYSIGFANAALSEYAGPGGWNDPDYILIGTVGDAHKRHSPPELTKLTHDEQYSYMSMWSLMASPLFFSGDMANLDPFTLNVLDNSEVIDIDQDSLGQQARVVRKTATEFVLAKKLEDGSTALGLFNLGEEPRTISADWPELHLRGRVSVRDVWRQSNIGEVEHTYAAPVAGHGVMLVRLSPVKAASSRPMEDN